MIKSFSLMVAASLSAVASANEIAVSDVTLTQSDSRLVTVSYKLGSKPAIVTVDFLTNGVSIGEENFSNISWGCKLPCDGNGRYSYNQMAASQFLARLHKRMFFR